MIAIGEAIDSLQDECCVPNSVFMTKKYQAKALGIEALQLVKELQSLPGRRSSFWLPGQTED